MKIGIEEKMMESKQETNIYLAYFYKGRIIESKMISTEELNWLQQHGFFVKPLDQLEKDSKYGYMAGGM